jgi:predicted Zn-dependent protease
MTNFRLPVRFGVRFGVLSLIAILTSVVCAPVSAQTFNLNAIGSVVSGLVEGARVSNISEAEEIQIGKEISARVLGAAPLVKNEAAQRYLNRVGTWVALHTERRQLPWRFGLIESPTINAFAAPGGIILVTRGLYASLENEAEMACVAAHEIAHVNMKHHLDLIQKGALTQAGAKLLEMRSGGNEIKQFAIGQGAEIFTRSLDRGAELDADSKALVYVAAAGYDPGACPAVMKRLAAMKADASSLAMLYKTHPAPADRAVRMEEDLGKLAGAPAGSGLRPELATKIK